MHLWEKKGLWWVANCHLKLREGQRSQQSVTQDKSEPSWQTCPLSGVPTLPTVLGMDLPSSSLLPGSAKSFAEQASSSTDVESPNYAPYTNTYMSYRAHVHGTCTSKHPIPWGSQAPM